LLALLDAIEMRVWENEKRVFCVEMWLLRNKRSSEGIMRQQASKVAAAQN
jgi:hypothetical protein